MELKRAVLVGIDNYQSLPALRGCVNDVNALLPLLASHEDESPNFECHQCTSPAEYIGRRQLLEAVDTLVAPGADVGVFYFAGHGVRERNDVVLVAQDGAPPDLGVSFSQVLGAVQESDVSEVLIILDCCFSGNAGSLPQLGPKIAALRDGVSILTASRGDQTSRELTRGVFSTNLCAALGGGASDVRGRVDSASLYAYLSESFGALDQRPTFKANVDRLHTLRICSPAVPLPDLRRLPKIFTNPDVDLPLDPSFEESHPSATPENMKIMKILQTCRAARLVEPVGTPHLFYAAIESKSCRLTPLGKHYWHLAQQKRI
jgi:caspase domain-containing protein